MKGNPGNFKYVFSDNGLEANPVLVAEQLNGIRESTQKFRASRSSDVLLEKEMSHLQELAQRMKGTPSTPILRQKKVGDLRMLAKRIKAVGETAPDPITAEKLAHIKKH